MPRIARLDRQPPLPVQIAVQCFGSPVAVSLLQHFREESTVNQAQEALGVGRTVMDKHIRTLVAGGALAEVRAPQGAIGGIYRTDPWRVADLLGELSSFIGTGARYDSDSGKATENDARPRRVEEPQPPTT